MKDVALLAPVPLEHLKSGITLCQSEKKLALGSKKWEVFKELDELRNDKPVPVLIYASGENLDGPATISWVGQYIGHVNSLNGSHPEGMRFRPPSTANYEADNAGHWAIFWHITELSPLEESNRLPISELSSLSSGKYFKANFIPKGPEIISVGNVPIANNLSTNAPLLDGRSQINSSSDGPTTEQFIYGLGELLKNPSAKIQNGFSMLIANYKAPGRKITAGALATAAGYDAFSVANEQYGSFAHRLCEILEYTPQHLRDNDPIWTTAICNASDTTDQDGHFQWVLKGNVAKAMEAIGLVKPQITKDPITDLDEQQDKLNQLSSKEREAVVKARVGQGVFRERLMNYWGGCSVTGHPNMSLLIASHIKPWRDCNASEATSLVNGLLLTPNLDLAFDRGLISFDEAGAIILSPQLSQADIEVLGLSPDMKLRKLVNQHNEFLEFHRINVFLSDA